MTQEEIIEGNKLIAKFMGAKWYDNYMGDSPCWKGGDKEMRYLLDNTTHLDFDSSWDWLMFVVVKIESLANVVTIEGNMCIINDYKYANEYAHQASDNSKIEATWLAVIKFINYYNQQKIK